MALSASEAAVLSTRMSPASMAATLGRSEAWVRRNLKAMAEAAAEAAEALLPAAEPAPTSHQVTDPPVLTLASLGVQPDPSGVYAGIVDAEGAAPEPGRTRQVAAPTMHFDLSGANMTRQLYDQLNAMADRRVRRLKPVTPRVVGWARRFLAAGYGVGDVAELFDRCPDQLAEALGR